MSAPVSFECHGPLGVLRPRQSAALHALSSATVDGLAAAVACFEAAATLPFAEGAAVQARLLNACRVSPDPVDMADVIGLATIVERLAHDARQRGNAHGDGIASALLNKRASNGQRLSG